MDDEQHRRDNMVRLQLEARGIHDQRVLEAMRRVPRSMFVPDDARALAYEDRPLPIGCGQTISQPYIVALMVQALQLQPGDSVLDIGTGSGYAAAVMGCIAGRVDTIERHGRLALQAGERLRALACSNVHVHVGDGTEGLPSRAPFHAIVAAASGPIVPPAWREQLTIGGRLVMPMGGTGGWQHLVRITRHGQADYAQEHLGEVRFVPLIGRHGWRPDPETDDAE